MTNLLYAVVYGPESGPVGPPAREPDGQVESEVKGALLVDPMYRLPQLSLATVVREAGLGRLAAARSLVDAMRFVVSAHPSVIIASWLAQLPELLAALDECYAPGRFPQITVAVQSEKDYETAVNSCERFPVIVVRADQLAKCLVQRLAKPKRV
jgi:hypothetical protein